MLFRVLGLDSQGRTGYPAHFLKNLAMKKIFTLIVAMLITLAGFSQTTTPPVTTQVTLTGKGSDSDGTIVSYSWKQISGPAYPTIVTPNSANTVVKDYSVPGVYLYELMVTDNRGGIAKDTTQVTVLQAANILPHADAGATITIQLPPATSENLIQKRGSLLESIRNNSKIIASQIQRSDCLYTTIITGLEELKELQNE